MIAATHYEMLGVSRRDSARFIDSAFRDLARECHPERQAVPTHHFEAVLRAFDVLSSAPQRAVYDRALADRPGRVDTTHAAWSLSVTDDFHGASPSRDEVLDAFRRNFTREGLPKSGRVAPLDLELVMHEHQVERSPDVELGFPVFHPCPACHGTGHEGAFPCRHCDQHGLQEDRADTLIHVTGDAVVERTMLRHGVGNLMLRVCVRVRR